MANIFDAINERIYDFVRRRQQTFLMPGTGYYSTLFRGKLFGLQMSAAVAKELSARGRVDVLWLGTNPRVRRSLDFILKAPRGDGDFPSFVRQIRSGLFAAHTWGATGRPAPDWNPIESPTRNWSVYRDTLKRVAPLDCIAMANFFPWGSDSSDALVAELGRWTPHWPDLPDRWTPGLAGFTGGRRRRGPRIATPAALR